MDKRIIAGAVVLAFLFTAMTAGVVASDSSDAVPESVSVLKTENATQVVLYVNGPAASSDVSTVGKICTYSAENKPAPAQEDTGSLNVVSGTPTTMNYSSGSVSLTNETSVYKVALTLDTTGMTADKSVRLGVKFTTTLAGSDSTIVQHLLFEVKVVNAPAAIETVTLKVASGAGGAEVIGNINNYLKVGTEAKLTLSVDATPELSSSAKWYAEGLPDGLTMNDKGVISGIPVNTTSKTVNITIYDEGVKVYKASVSMQPSAAAKATLKVSDVKIGENPALDSTATLSMGANKVPRYVVSTDDTLKFTVTSTNLGAGDTVTLYQTINGVDTKIGSTISSNTATDVTGVKVAGEGEYLIKAVLNDGLNSGETMYLLSVVAVDKVTHANAGITFELDTVPAAP